MSISEQVKELRNFGCFGTVKKMMDEAADTIESLSAKLADMEWSAEDCGGGWIMCDKDNLPEHEVLCCDNYGEMILGYIAEEETGETGFCAENDNVFMYNCVKWMEKPKS